MASTLGSLCKMFVALALVLVLPMVLLLFNSPDCRIKDFLSPVSLTSSLPSPPAPDPTNISHLVFGLVGSTEAWRHRKTYIESWWRQNITRGYLYLDKPPTEDLLPWSRASPPFRVSDDNTKLLEESKHVAPIMVRMVHAVIEVFREEKEGVRWYVMGDDDSIFFVDNLVSVLSKYDHNNYIYIGGHSESILSNYIHSFDMGFGGAGLILSYPLAKMVQKNIEDCFKRYPYLRVADQILMTCVNDFGVYLTAHQGLHQMDLHGDISGFLSAHPQAPLLSLHHFDKLDPIFPSMDRSASAKHLMKAANVDQSRLVQQTVCYDKARNWSFSVSWGYSAQIYEKIIPRSILKIPLETFKPWVHDASPPLYLFNTRRLSKDPCEAPHLFSFKSITKTGGDGVLTGYIRVSRRGLPACSSTGNQSADFVSKVEVFSSIAKPVENGRSECCDVLVVDGMEVAKVKLRACRKDELIA